MPIPHYLALAALPLLGLQTPSGPDVLPLLDFADADTVSAFRPVHDSVMGGISDGSARAIEGAARLAGEVSLERNGGFASFRIGARLPDLTERNGLRLRVRGDGQVYKLSLRTDGRWEGVSWQAPFATTADEWTTIDLPFAELTPSWRGRFVGDAGAFDASSILELGIVIADKQAGEFSIDVSSIDAWSAPAKAAPAGSLGAMIGRTAALASVADSDPEAVAETLRWSERIVVVAEPGQLGAETSKQLGALFADLEALANRELRVVHLMGNGGGRLAGQTLSRAQVEGLRERWGLATGDWTVALVGKDGGVKSRWSERIEPSAIFTLVDAMPMRTDELRGRRAL